MIRPQVAPLEDYGFFGPGSVAWKVFSYPTTLTVAFQRTVTTEMYDPFLLASVQQTGAVLKRPGLRYDRTMQYMATVVFGDARSVLNASETLVKIHSKIVGTEPISGLQYDANDPDAQLWIHLTAWHSVLYCYEKFGPGKLTPQEEAQYWRECARAAQFQTIDPASVPRSREDMRQYYARVRPRLAVTEATLQHVHHLLNSAKYVLPERFWLWPVRKTASALFRKATIATLPQWMRRMAGVRQTAMMDVIVTITLRWLMSAVNRHSRLARWLVGIFTPLTAPIADPFLCGVPPMNPITWTPEQAREFYHKLTPADQYSELRRTQQKPVHPPRDRDDQLLAFNPLTA